MRFRLQIVQVFPPLFHFFPLRAPVVVLLDHTLTDVRSVANDLIWHVAVETVRDASPPDRVRTHTGRALVGGITRHSFTLFGVTVVRAFILGDARSCPPVDVGAKRRLVGSSLARGQQWLPTEFVGDRWSFGR